MAFHSLVHERRNQTMERITEAVCNVGGTSKEIAGIVGLSQRHAALCISELVNDGIVKRDKVRGVRGIGPNSYRYRAPEYKPIIFRTLEETHKFGRDEAALAVARRNMRIYRLRRRGKNYSEIASIVGMSAPGVFKAMRRMVWKRTFFPALVHLK